MIKLRSSMPVMPKRCGLLLLFILIFGTTFSQTIITGRVTNNSTDSALNAVSVQVKGGAGGTSTDEKGIFRLPATLPAILMFTSVGYQTQQVRVDRVQNLAVRLVPADESLNQVVVVAYGTQKKETVTGAIASIRTREIKQSPAANLAVTLAGRLPGLTSIQRSGQPGKDASALFIRGLGTTNGQSPIILVDGVERDLTYVDPNEVESVSILKDASSTAIFGVRGANGVILVTTRRGSSEEPAINFTAEYGLQDFTRRLKPVDAYQYATLTNLARTNDSLGAKYSDEAIAHYRDQDDPAVYPNNDWQKIFLKPYTQQSRYNLNISGGSKNARYFVNAGYLTQGGQFRIDQKNYDPSFKLDRYNFRSNVDINVNKRLKAFLNVAGYLENQNQPAGLSISNLDPAILVLNYINQAPSLTPGPLTPDGQVVTSTDPPLDHPAYGLLNRSGFTQNTSSNVLATFGLEQSLDFITSGLSVRAVASFDTRSIRSTRRISDYARYQQNIVKAQDGSDSSYFTQVGNVLNTPLSSTINSTFRSYSNFQVFVNYLKTIASKHTITGLLLFQQDRRIEFNDPLPFAIRGVSGRITYNYDNRYFAEFNAGYNGSEQFKKGQRYGFFPSVSAGWVISKEKFLRNSNVISLLKLRGSAGRVGNDRLSPDPNNPLRFLYLDNISAAGGGYSSGLGNGQVINEAFIGNPNLTWEIAEKANLGFELGLFNSLNLTVDVFTERRNNVLGIDFTVPAINGLPSSSLPPLNYNHVKNAGYEIELNYNKRVARDLNILAKLNLQYAQNEITLYKEAQLPSDYAYRYRSQGYSIGQPFGYVVDRYFTDYDDIAKSPVQQVGAAPRPGNFKYKDLNGDGIIDSRDIAPIGYSGIPQYMFGAAMNLSYKNLDISVLFQGAMNSSTLFGEAGVVEYRTNFFAQHLYSWTPERAASGAEIDYPRLTTALNQDHVVNSFFLVNTDFVRLKNAEIGYTLPLRWASKVGAQRVRIYANGLNLITWDKIPFHQFDPESNGDAGNTYPVVKTYNFGVNVTF